MSTGPSLYRRHRPRTFTDVVGQEHVVRTLRNAVEQGKVHHAYLFVGSRGTGKTSMAKILAACLNCEQGPTIEPCGVCESCVAIASATSLDVIEMDAASNNSVDDIRDLRDKVGYAPVSGRSKVYILDEAHMLSPQAWNAFLKTLEEPPPNTIFVLATTEAQKVLPTVVDRCHRFDFARPGAEQIAGVLRRVADAEEIAVPDAALALLARHASGSFRDALGTLEQLVTYSGTEITLDDVLAVLGVADADLLFGALDAVAAHDGAAALRAAARLAASGRDAGQFLRDIETHARELLAVQILGEVPGELRLTPDHDERLFAQAQRLGAADVVRVLDLVAAAYAAMADGAESRIQLELVLLKAAVPEVDPAAAALLVRLERLEARLAGERAPEAASPPPPTPPEPRKAEPPRSAPAAGAPPMPAPMSARPRPADVAAAAPAAAAAVAEHSAPLDIAAARELWPQVVATVRERNALAAALLGESGVVAVDGDEIVVAFPSSAAFAKRKAEGDGQRRTVTEALHAVAGRPLSLRYELRDDVPPAAVAPSTLSEEELVRRIMEDFDAEEVKGDD